MSTEQKPNKILRNVGLIGLVGLGIWGAVTAVNSRVQDFTNVFKLFIANFKIIGFAKDNNGKNVYTEVDTLTKINLANASATSVRIPDLTCSIEFQAPDKNWYSIGTSSKPVAVNIAPKQNTYIDLPIRYSLSEIFIQKLIFYILKPVNIRVNSSFSVFGVQQNVSTVVAVTLPNEILKAIGILKGLGYANQRCINGAGALCLPSPNLGYTASKLRTLKSGTEYSSLIEGINTPNKRIVLNPNASTEKTVEYINQIARETTYQTSKLASVIFKKYKHDVRALAKAMYQFVYDHIQYKLDKDTEEELREPRRLWKDRKTGGDCDCMALFSSTILRNLGVLHFFRTVKMRNNSNYQHIYIIVPIPGKKFVFHDTSTYVVIDPVMEYFDGRDPQGVTGIFDYAAK